MVSTTHAAAVSPSKHDTWKIFDRIADRYDLLNRLLSFRRDVAWRKFLIRHLPSGECLRVLDLATGTADVLLALHADSDRVKRGVGADLSANMLARGRAKIARRGLANELALVRTDAAAVGFRDGSFDAVTMAFGIRNVPDPVAALREVKRLLARDGRALILEFSLPRRAFLRGPYLFYFRHVLPRVGGLVSGDSQAYRYLNESVEEFPHGQAFLDLMTEAGFENVRAYPLTFGIATLYCGDRSATAQAGLS